MSKGRKLLTKPRTRLKKTPRERRRRIKEHKKRLAAMGIPAEKIALMENKQIRAILRMPPRRQAKLAPAKV